MRAAGHSSSQGRRGFSLVELMIVLVILSLLSAIAMPRYANSIARYRASSAAQRIAADLALAQTQARNTSMPLTVAFNAANQSYQIAGLTSLDNRSSNYTVSLAADPYLARFTTISLNGATQVTFNAYGMPDKGGSIVIKSGNAANTIALDASSGRATVQ